MKTITSSIVALAILLTSCGDVPESTEKTTEAKTEEGVTENKSELVEEEPTTEEIVAEAGGRLDNISNETAISDCYIVDAFVDMDTRYITVDFVTYTLDEDSQHTDYEVYDLVNDNPKLRTFVVHGQYMDCGRSKEVSIDDLIEKSKKDEKTVFSLETIEGIVTELYIDICSG